MHAVDAQPAVLRGDRRREVAGAPQRVDALERVAGRRGRGTPRAWRSPRRGLGQGDEPAPAPSGGQFDACVSVRAGRPPSSARRRERSARDASTAVARRSRPCRRRPSGAGRADDLPQLLRRRVALDPEGHADALEAVAVLVGQAEAPRTSMSPSTVDSTAVRARRGRRRRRRARSSGTPRARAAGLGGVRRPVVADQDGRLAGVEHERLLARGVLLPGGVEPSICCGCARRPATRSATRNWNAASAGCGLIASSVPNICAVSTPLRIFRVLRSWRNRTVARRALHRVTTPTVSGRGVGLHARSAQPPRHARPCPRCGASRSSWKGAARPCGR